MDVKFIAVNWLIKGIICMNDWVKGNAGDNYIMEHHCKKCGKTLMGDEIALYRKLVQRDAKEYLCLDCLSEELCTSREKLERLIAYYHRTGICCLFAQT